MQVFIISLLFFEGFFICNAVMIDKKANIKVPKILFFIPNDDAYFEVWTTSQPFSHIGGIGVKDKIKELMRETKNIINKIVYLCLILLKPHLFHLAEFFC